MSTETGGPAFPSTEANYHNENMRGDGMSLRDYFAAKAMQGAIAARGERGCDFQFINETELAKGCYRMSDAMLEARKVKP